MLVSNAEKLTIRITEALTNKAKFYEDICQQHEDDVATFKFKAIRHGDFFALFVTRGNKKFISACPKSPIEICSGIEPKIEGGVLHIIYDYEIKDYIYKISNYPRISKFYAYQLRVDFTTSNTGMVAVTGGAGGGSGWGYSNESPVETLPNFPLEASDSNIIFSGYGELNVPYGTEQMCFDELMRATKDE